MIMQNAGMFKSDVCALAQQPSQTVPQGQALGCYLGQPAKDVLCCTNKAWLPILEAQHQVGSCCLFVDSRGLPAGASMNVVAIFVKQFTKNVSALCP